MGEVLVQDYGISGKLIYLRHVLRQPQSCVVSYNGKAINLDAE